MDTSSPFRREHERAARLETVARGNIKPGTASSVLVGKREFGWPLLALQVQTSIGPCRHALAQMVVAGTMTVFPPFMSNRPGKDKD